MSDKWWCRFSTDELEERMNASENKVNELRKDLWDEMELFHMQCNLFTQSLMRDRAITSRTPTPPLLAIQNAMNSQGGAK